MARKMRVKRFSFRNKFESWQLLQEKRWWGWATLDREDIPHHVLIDRAVFGDWGNWRSKFGELGTFGPDGAFTPHDPSVFARKPGVFGKWVKRLLACSPFTSIREVRA